MARNTEHTHTPTVGKEYMCFQNNGKNAQAAKCIKSGIMTKAIDSIFLIETFEQKTVVIKGMLKPLRLKDHLKNIGIKKSLSKNALYIFSSKHQEITKIFWEV